MGIFLLSKQTCRNFLNVLNIDIQVFQKPVVKTMRLTVLTYGLKFTIRFVPYPCSSVHKLQQH